MTAKRIYLVAPKPGTGSESIDRACLVRANTQAQAIGHAVRNRYTASVATQDQIVDLVSLGAKVEEAGE